jgi:hypothetical protein
MNSTSVDCGISCRRNRREFLKALAVFLSPPPACPHTAKARRSEAKGRLGHHSPLTHWEGRGLAGMDATHKKPNPESPHDTNEITCPE